MKKIIIMVLTIATIGLQGSAQVFINTVVGNGNTPSSTSTYPIKATNTSVLPTGGLAFNGDYLLVGDSDFSVKQINVFTGVMTVLAGTPGTAGNSGDNGLASNATLTDPRGIATDTGGNVYFCDHAKNVIRRIDAKTGIITRIVGLQSGTAGYNGDNTNGTSVQISAPWGLAYDSINSRLYFTDKGNALVRYVDLSSPTYEVVTVAGDKSVLPGHSGDGGPATSAQLSNPMGIDIDNSGNFYVSEDLYIRKIDAAGNINTIAGNGSVGYTSGSNPGTSSSFGGLIPSVKYRGGNLYIADPGNNRIRVLDNTGMLFSHLLQQQSTLLFSKLYTRILNH